MLMIEERCHSAESGAPLLLFLTVGGVCKVPSTFDNSVIIMGSLKKCIQAVELGRWLFPSHKVFLQEAGG